MKPNDPPKAIYLQVHGVDRRELSPEHLDKELRYSGETTWREDKIFDTDVRYVIDKRYLRGKKR